MLVEVSPIGVSNAELERLLDTFVVRGVCVVRGVWCVCVVCVACLLSV